MTVCFYPADDGTWHAKIGHEELIIGKGIVEYYWYDPNADEDEAPVLQHRSVWFDDRDKATLTEYRDALRADCAGLRYMGEGLKWACRKVRFGPQFALESGALHALLTF